MAKCFTMGIRSDLSKAVKGYFDKFSVLPPKNIRVDSTSDIKGSLSFEHFIKTISKSPANEFVLVVHGHENGGGLYLSLVSGNNSVQTTRENLKILNDIADKKDGKISPIDKKKLALTDAHISRLLKLRGELHKKQIKMVEFRGCNLGRDLESVKQFRSFFGAGNFGAPKLHSFFGSQPTGSGRGLMTSHTISHKGTTYTYTSDFNGKKCHCCFGLNARNKPKNGHVVADDESTIDRWIQANFSATATKGNAKKIAVHGLWFIPQVKIVNIDPTDIVDPPRPRPIFPLAKDAKGNNEYRMHMTYSP